MSHAVNDLLRQYSQALEIEYSVKLSHDMIKTIFAMVSCENQRIVRKCYHGKRDFLPTNNNPKLALDANLIDAL
jgi:hypothetical protein